MHEDREKSDVLALREALRRDLPTLCICCGHQELNAGFLVDHGGAVKLADRDLPRGALLPLVLSLLADRQRLEAMAAAMGTLARPDAAEHIAWLIRSVAMGRPPHHTPSDA
jgi:UDP-N-acetylglucosamine:LPS N-acetylglucosamine transferase